MGSARVEYVAQWWEGHFYPDAGEVVGWRETRLIREGERESYPPGMVMARPERGVSAVLQPGREEDNRARASRRARTTLRRYAASNRLRYLWVLTFAPEGEAREGEHDLARCKRRTALFVKRGLRRDLGYDGPYVVGWERHKSGAWHVNVLVDRRLEHAKVAEAWARGFVYVSKFRARNGGQRDAARVAASYVAKYITKEFADLPGRVHRYEVGQGFQIRKVRVFGLSVTGLLAECGPVVYKFLAASPEAGRGPPIVWAAIAEHTFAEA